MCIDWKESYDNVDRWIPMDSIPMESSDNKDDIKCVKCLKRETI